MNISKRASKFIDTVSLYTVQQILKLKISKCIFFFGRPFPAFRLFWIRDPGKQGFGSASISCGSGSGSGVLKTNADPDTVPDTDPRLDFEG